MRPSRAAATLLLLLLFSALACNIASGGDEPTPGIDILPTEVPTDILAPTDTPSPLPTRTPQETPTESPPTDVPSSPTPTPSQTVLELDSTPYADPQGLFDIYPPLGWTAETKEGGATFAAPDDSGFVNVEVTNTGIVLDGDAFENFVDARDINLFGGFEEYEVLNRQVDLDTGVARITKRLLFDGQPQVVLTLYDQHDQSVFSLDFWANTDLAPAYRDVYEEIIETTSVDGALASSEVDMYYWIYDFFGPDDLFTIEVPIPWRHETAEGEVAIVDTFYSPDEHAIIQNITHDDGVEISRAEAGAFALETLRNYYATDIRITDDQVQPDGSERLTWDSPSGGYSGISFLETRGTAFLLFSVMWDDPFEDIYFDVLDYTIGSYEVPE